MTGPIPPKDAKPGSWYWLRILTNDPFPAKWTGERWTLVGRQGAYLPDFLAGWTYLGPCLPPPDHTASVTEVTRVRILLDGTQVFSDHKSTQVIKVLPDGPPHNMTFPAQYLSGASMDTVLMHGSMPNKPVTEEMLIAALPHPVSPAVERGEPELLANDGWLPIVSMPTDGNEYEIKLPNGEIFLGRFKWPEGQWQIGSEIPNARTIKGRGGLSDQVVQHTMRVWGKLKDGVYPTHYRIATLPHPTPPVPVSGDGEAE